MTEKDASDRFQPPASTSVLVVLGLITGALSGLFGVGGGIIVVPALLILGFDQRRAAGTSVAAILPTAVVGAAGYALVGDINWVAGVALAVGAIVGAQIGSWLLARLPRAALFWSFFVFLIFSIVSLWVSTPQRDADIDISPISTALLVVAGVAVGVISAVLGIGGGVVLVPLLMFFFGASDLVAKGTSLFMMIPGSISATIGNKRRGNVDLRAAALIGFPACVASPLGILAANLLSPFWANAAFSVLMAAASTQLLIREIRRRRPPASPSGAG